MKNIPFARPNISKKEITAVSKTLKGPILVHGPKIIEFENEFQKFTKAPYAVSVSSCTAGMHLIYFTLGLGAGDEVLLPSQSHVATNADRPAQKSNAGARPRSSTSPNSPPRPPSLQWL